jgi:hypothetical protein
MHVCRALAPAVVLAAVSWPSPAAANRPQQAECIDAYTDGQELKHAGALRRARERLLICARDPCSPVLVRDCVSWLEEIERKLPTVVVEARDSQGHDINDVGVWIDGAEVASKLDGRAIEIDPGEHKLRLTHTGNGDIEQPLTVREGDKGRRLSFAFPAPVRPEAAVIAPAPAPTVPRDARPETQKRGIPGGVYPLGAASVLALGVSAYFGVKGLRLRGDLDACKGACPSDRVNDARHSFLASDIALGVAVVSLAAAAVVWLTADRGPHGHAATRR